MALAAGQSGRFEARRPLLDHSLVCRIPRPHIASSGYRWKCGKPVLESLFATGVFLDSWFLASNLESCMARKVILDVDPGIDDALGRSLALFDPGLEVVAVTATGGNVPAQQATINVQTIVELLDPARLPRLARPRSIYRCRKILGSFMAPTGWAMPGFRSPNCTTCTRPKRCFATRSRRSRGNHHHRARSIDEYRAGHSARLGVRRQRRTIDYRRWHRDWPWRRQSRSRVQYILRSDFRSNRFAV